MSRFIDALSCLRLFIQISVGHSLHLLWVATNISSCSFDYFRYGFVELIHEKSDFLEAFKAFKAKVELQQGKKIEVVHMRGGEYYGKYDETRRNPGPFAKYLQECGIDAQYTRLGTPQQNGIAERRNHTLLDLCDVCLLIPHYLNSCGVKL